MRNWRSLYEILKFPIEAVLIGVIMIGLGNLFTNSALGVVGVVNNEAVQAVFEMLKMAGQFIVVNFPVLVMIRLTTRRGGSATTIISAIAGYISYLAATTIFTETGLASTAYSSILGLSLTRTTLTSLSGTVRYPLQTGVIGSVIVALITLWSYKSVRKRNEYGLFSFISKESSCVLRVIFFSFLAGIGMSFVWPYIFHFLQRVVRFISADTTNPVNLTLYGITDRFLSDLNLGTIIRQPFWYASNGGSWVNVAGSAVAGDVNIWPAQLNANALTGMAGRFITPFYVLNLFAVPTMIWAMQSLNTDPIARGRMMIFCVIMTVVSWVSGSLLPLELMLMLLCPLLYVFHLGFTGVLDGVLHALHVYLGYNTTTTNTITAVPGTLPEFITYIGYPSLMSTLITVAVVGIVTGVIYFVVTRLYFKYLAVDLFRTGAKDTLVNEMIKAVGGVDNIKVIHSSVTSLTISVFDSSKLDVDRLRHLGSYRVLETRVGYEVCFGAASTMIRLGIQEAMRENIRDINLS